MNKSLRFVLATSLLLLAGTLSARAQMTPRPPRTTDYRFKPVYYLMMTDNLSDVPVAKDAQARPCSVRVGGTITTKHVSVTPGFELSLSADGPFSEQVSEDGEFMVYIRSLGNPAQSANGTVRIEGSQEGGSVRSVSFPVSSRVN
ncbi:hypothetical protein GCM10027578_30700 [Spirosoma luteolum]